MRPQAALEGNERGEMMLMPPTLASLRDLSEFDDVDAVLEAASGRTVTRILPKLLFDENDQLKFLLPHEPGYPHSD
jgi:hypothetical protein